MFELTVLFANYEIKTSFRVFSKTISNILVLICQIFSRVFRLSSSIVFVDQGIQSLLCGRLRKRHRDLNQESELVMVSGHPCLSIYLDTLDQDMTSTYLNNAEERCTVGKLRFSR